MWECAEAHDGSETTWAEHVTDTQHQSTGGER